MFAGPLVETLGRVALLALIEPLMTAMKDGNSDVREPAADALGQIAPLLSEAERAQVHRDNHQSNEG